MSGWKIKIPAHLDHDLIHFMTVIHSDGVKDRTSDWSCLNHQGRQARVLLTSEDRKYLATLLDTTHTWTENLRTS